MHEVESMRSATGRPASLVQYFVNNSVNQQTELSACMQSMAIRVGVCRLQPLTKAHTRCFTFIGYGWLGARVKRASEEPSVARTSIEGASETACRKHTPCSQGPRCCVPISQSAARLIPVSVVRPTIGFRHLGSFNFATSLVRERID